MKSTAADAFARRDFWLCLARAFAPPGGEDYLIAFRNDLSADLAAIGEEMGLRLTAEVALLKQEADRLPDAVELQKLYSALFLTPPTPVMLNTGLYIDGSLMGRSELELREFYARHGFERHAHFRDLNDTVAIQAEFLALLYGKAGERATSGDGMEARAYLAEAEDFTRRFPARWITPFLRAIEAAGSRVGLNAVYAHLARILWLAVEGSVESVDQIVSNAGLDALPSGSARGIGALTAQDLAEIAWCLKRDGLSFDHIVEQDNWDHAVFEARCKEHHDAQVSQ